MMKSNFLNLPSSASGDARRHVPFRSIINKHFSILFVLVFVFSILFSYVHPVAALADPVFQPVYDTQFYQLPQFVDPLNSTQQDIFYFILGSQVVEYAGLSDYQIENPYSDPSSVGEWFKKIGIDLYNDVLESFAIAGAPVIVGSKWVKDLYANIAGAANFAGAFNNSSWNDWFNDVQTNGLNLQSYPSVNMSLNQYFALKGSLYNWQNRISDFHSNVSWVTTNNAPESSVVQYFNIVNGFDAQRIRANRSRYTNYNVQLSSNWFTTYHNLFINTQYNAIYFLDDYGNSSNIGYQSVFYLDNYLVGQWDESDSFIAGYSYNPNTYTTLNDVVQNFYDFNIVGPLHNVGYFDLFYEDFIDHVYYGDSWDNKVELLNETNLNFDENNNQDFVNPVIDTLLDIKGLINDILEQNELKQPVLDNLTDLNGDPLPAAQLQPVSVAIELPDSGITINSGLFTPLTKDGGYINYLWYMTKPLVQYTSDFIQTLVFPDDTGEGFDATGPGVIVFGVICLGLIGGLVVKCLL